MPRPSCANCEAYEYTPDTPENEERARAAGTMHLLVRGRCRRYPVPVLHTPEDLCHEHSDLARDRMRVLAIEIAAALSAKRTEG